MKKYDLKLGYACNNNCIHCVVKPNYMKPSEFTTKSEMDNSEKPLNFSYSQIIKILDSKEVSEAQEIVLTGGEPTVRKDFIPIVKYIKKTYPHMNIIIQTNGRKLKQYAKELYEIDDNIYFVIALHASNAELHNFIVNNKKDTKTNPYQETIDSIKELKKYYSKDHVSRIETVWSIYNYMDAINLLNWCVNEEIKNIGFSYPHFDGFFMKDKSYAATNSVSFTLLKPYLLQIVQFAKLHPEININLEAVPKCMLLSTEKDEELPSNLIIEHSNVFEEETFLQYPNQEKQEFKRQDLYKKKDTCVSCIYNKSCHGTWWEALELFPEDNFIPIKKEN